MAVDLKTLTSTTVESISSNEIIDNKDKSCQLLMFACTARLLTSLVSERALGDMWHCLRWRTHQQQLQ